MSCGAGVPKKSLVFVVKLFFFLKKKTFFFVLFCFVLFQASNEKKEKPSENLGTALLLAKIMLYGDEAPPKQAEIDALTDDLIAHDSLAAVLAVLGDVKFEARKDFVTIFNNVLRKEKNGKVFFFFCLKRKKKNKKEGNCRRFLNVLFCQDHFCRLYCGSSCHFGAPCGWSR